MKSLEQIRAEWGSDGFEAVPADLVGDSLPGSVRSALCEIGLPVRPRKSLELNLRFENVRVEHRPREVRLVGPADFEAGSPFPRSGDEELDAETLGGFLRIGECPNDFSGSGYLTRFICVDSRSGRVYWVFPRLSEGRNDAFRINSSLHSYLGSLLAYKVFRDQWPALMAKYPEDTDFDYEAYEGETKPMHGRFLRDLEAADPGGFKNGFWEEHAWNEAILLEV